MEWGDTENHRGVVQGPVQSKSFLPWLPSPARQQKMVATSNKDLRTEFIASHTTAFALKCANERERRVR